MPSCGLPLWKGQPGGQTPGGEAGNAPTFLLSDSQEIEGGHQQGHQQDTHHAHRNEDTIQVPTITWRQGRTEASGAQMRTREAPPTASLHPWTGPVN